MECLEDGELPSSPEDLRHTLEIKKSVSTQPIYTPLIRPQVVSSSNQGPSAQAANISGNKMDSGACRKMGSAITSNNDLCGETGTFTSSSSGLDSSNDDSDSDNHGRKGWSSTRPKVKKSRKFRLQKSNDRAGTDRNHGDDFKNAVAAYQNSIRSSNSAMASHGHGVEEKRKGSNQNNVWGSILREDALTSELTGIAVGRKSAKDLNSDRGAEAYDYSVAAEFHAATRLQDDKKKKDALNRDLDQSLEQYWNNTSKDAIKEEENNFLGNRKEDAICAGKKRSVKERLGARKSHQNIGQDEEGPALDDMSIPQPGMPRTIPDLSTEFIKILQGKHKNINETGEASFSKEIDDMEDEDLEDGLEDTTVEYLGEELAARLCEPKTELMVGVVDLVGGQVALELFQKTQKIESEGGMMIKNGERRRTPGGVFLHLLREMTDDPRVDPKKVKQFFAQSQKIEFHREHKSFQHTDGKQHKGKSYQRISNTSAYSKDYNKQQRHNRNGKDCQEKENSFENELAALRKLSQKAKDEREKARQAEAAEQAIAMEDEDIKQDMTDESLNLEEEIKPLPDILTCISKHISEDNDSNSCNALRDENEPEKCERPPYSPNKNVSHHDLLASCQPSTSSSGGASRSNRPNATSQLDNFEEPEAPPNSVERVERTISTYEDDLLTDFNTEDIELF